MSTLQQILVIW